MLHIYKNIAAFSLRLKGPASQRLKKPSDNILEEIKVEDQFKEYYQDTLQLYKNNFTPDELQDANESVRRVFSLANATPREILSFRISQAVKKYQNNINDHGSAAVQCASMSERIILLMMHVKKYPTDKKAGRYLTKLVSDRRAMMNFLMKKDFHKFEWICLDYGVPVVHPTNAQHNRDKGLFENTYRKIF